MIKQICLRLPQELYDSIKNNANASGLSVTKYIISTLTEVIQNSQQESMDEFTEDFEMDSNQLLYTYRFNPEDAKLLKQKAKALNLADTAYLRLLIRTKNFKYIDYSTDDLREYISQSQRLIDSVTDFVDFIRTSGKGLVFEQDVRRILVMLEEIKDLHKKQIQITFTDRQSVYRKMIKKIEEAF